MGLIKEPKNVDFTVESQPWTAKELSDFRKLMKVIKQQNNKLNPTLLKKKGKTKQLA